MNAKKKAWLMALAAQVGGWDITKTVYDEISFYVNANAPGPLGLFFKPDGTVMYVTDINNDNVVQYLLSTAWDISTASYDDSFFVGTQEGTPHGLFFKPDGTKMYILGYTTDKVYQYSLSTAWDVSTASYDNKSYDPTAQEVNPRVLSFKLDGTKMYVLGTDSDTIYQYSLSTAWDVSTASYDNKSYDPSTQSIGALMLSFKPDGKKMYVMSINDDTIYQYSLSTAWDVSTASYDNKSYTQTQEGTPRDMFFKPDGTKMYVVGSLDTVYQYSL